MSHHNHPDCTNKPQLQEHRPADRNQTRVDGVEQQSPAQPQR
jgi:hypothetical protein